MGVGQRKRSRERSRPPLPALIVSLSLRPGIPWRVALQHCPPPLPRLAPCLATRWWSTKPPPQPGWGIFNRRKRDFSSGLDTSMAVDIQGRIFVGFTRNTFSSVLLRSSNSGSTFTTLSNPVVGLGGVRDIELATDALGRLHLASLAYAQSTDAGDSFTTPLFINNFIALSFSDHRLEVSNDGQSLFWVGTAKPLSSVLPTDIYSAVSTNAGASWSPLVNISTNPGGSVGLGVSALPSGGALVVWDDDTQGNFDILLKKIP